MSINLWCEKYRPKTVQECILTNNLKNIFSGILKEEKLPNLLLAGTCGIGKTTVAKAICRQLDLESLFINASLEGNIDTLRNKIFQFASTTSVSGKQKIIILDEADNLTSATQLALRSFIEQFSNICGFIFTANYPNKIIEAIHSRCSVISFVVSEKEKKDLFKDFSIRVAQILKKEEKKIELPVILQFIKKYFPDFRRILNELQRAFTGVEASIENLLESNEKEIENLANILREKSFEQIKQWVKKNNENYGVDIYSKIAHGMQQFIVPNTIPLLIMYCQKFQYEFAFSADPELCLLACTMHILADIEIKK